MNSNILQNNGNHPSVNSPFGNCHSVNGRISSFTPQRYDSGQIPKKTSSLLGKRYVRSYDAPSSASPFSSHSINGQIPLMPPKNLEEQAIHGRIFSSQENFSFPSHSQRTFVQLSPLRRMEQLIPLQPSRQTPRPVSFQTSLPLSQPPSTASLRIPMQQSFQSTLQHPMHPIHPVQHSSLPTLRPKKSSLKHSRSIKEKPTLKEGQDEISLKDIQDKISLSYERLENEHSKSAQLLCKEALINLRESNFPIPASMLIQVAYIKFRLKDFIEADQLYSEAIEKTRLENRSFSHESISETVGDIRSIGYFNLVNAATCKINLNDFQGSKVLFDEIFALFPEQINPRDYEFAAYANMKLGLYDLAEQYYGLALKGLDSPDILCQMAILQLLMGKANLAEMYIERALNWDFNTSFEFFKIQGQSEAMINKYREEFTEINVREHNNFLKVAAQIKFALKKYIEADQLYSQSLEIINGKHSLKDTLWSAKLKYLIEDYDSARKLFEKILNTPRYTAILNLDGETLGNFLAAAAKTNLELGLEQVADILYKSAVHHLGANVDAVVLWNWGAVKFRLKEFSFAAKLFKEGIEKNDGRAPQWVIDEYNSSKERLRTLSIKQR